VTIIASGAPFMIRNVTTYVEAARGDVVVIWNSPPPNGASVMYYLIEI
jgi:hypothetical protein